MPKIIDFGVVARDVVTDFEGVITAVSNYWMGTTEVLLTAKIDENGKVPAAWFNIERIQPVEGMDCCHLPGEGTDVSRRLPVGFQDIH